VKTNCAVFEAASHGRELAPWVLVIHHEDAAATTKKESRRPDAASLRSYPLPLRPLSFPLLRVYIGVDVSCW
jgi:hypothetical protein